MALEELAVFFDATDAGFYLNNKVNGYEYITKNDFLTGLIYPSPNTLGGYANNEYVTKSDLVLPSTYFNLTWTGSVDTPWVLCFNERAGEYFMGPNYPNYNYGPNSIQLPMSLYSWPTGTYDNYYSGTVYVYAHIREGWGPNGLVWYNIDTFNLTSGGSRVIYIPEGI